MPTLHLASHASNVAVARRFVREVLEEWQCAGDTVDALVLCVSELVTNVVLHAGTPATVAVNRNDDGALRLEVSDRSGRLPVVRTVDAEALAGRGMRIVSSFSTRTGTDVTRDGKVVWVELDSS